MTNMPEQMPMPERDKSHLRQVPGQRPEDAPIPLTVERMIENWKRQILHRKAHKPKEVVDEEAKWHGTEVEIPFKNEGLNF